MGTTTTTQWILELVDKITGPMKGIADVSEEAAKGVDDIGEKADKAGNKLKNMKPIDVFAVSQSVNELANEFDKITAPGAAFNSQMKDLEAITGVTGDALDDLGGKARKMAKDFGGDASGMMESYKGVLSRLGPDIAKNSGALDLMEKDIATLSKTMGNDAPAAMDALTTSMLQFGVDLKDPQAAANEMTRMMNVMAAGAKEGAAEVPQISAALKQAGVQALDSKVSFEETNSALQALAQGGKIGAEAGVALRNVLGKMAGIDVVPREAAEKLKALGVNYSIVSDKTLPFTTRLRELKKAQGDATVMAQVFGVENAAAANILLRSTDYQDDMTKKITGTNVATEQAQIVMSGYTETLSRVKAWFTDLAIGAFGVTSKIAPMVEGLSGAVMVMANLSNARQGVSNLFRVLSTMPSISALVTGGFAAISTAATSLGVVIMNIPILGWIAALIAAIIALSVYFYKTSATFRSVLFGVWDAVKAVFTGIGQFITEVMQGIWHVIKGVFNPANWFDKSYKIADGFAQIADAAKKYGEGIGKAYSEGRDKGMASFYADNPDEDPALKAKNAEAEKKLAKLREQYKALENDKSPKGDTERNTIANAMEAIRKGSSGSLNINSTSPILTPKSLTKPTKEAGIGSNGGIKNISQKVDIKNYFTVSGASTKSDYEAIAEQLMRAVNDRMRDGIVVIS